DRIGGEQLRPRRAHGPRRLLQRAVLALARRSRQGRRRRARRSADALHRRSKVNRRSLEGRRHRAGIARFVTEIPSFRGRAAPEVAGRRRSWHDAVPHLRTNPMRCPATSLRRFGPLLLVLVALLVTRAAAAAEPFAFATTPGLLPKTVVPLHYAIDLKPDLA